MKKIIISRTDNLGDVMLTLPLAGYLKQRFPAAQIFFLGKSYTQPLIEACHYISRFLNREELLKSPVLLQEVKADAIIFVYPDKELAKLAKKINIPVRIGTSHRLFHWLYCNKLVNFTRKNSTLHEAQLNFKLLQPLGIQELPMINQLPDWYGFQPREAIPNYCQGTRLNLIIHPKSKGSAREWPASYYYELAKQLSPDQFQIHITGTQAEGQLIRQQQPELLALPHVQDLTGKLTLAQLISLIGQADGLVACSTGPLHIAAALGKRVAGIYPPIKPMHPGRWGPVGKQTKVFVRDISCEACRKTQDCACIRSIAVQKVYEEVVSWTK